MRLDGIGTVDFAPVYLAGNLVTGVNCFCVLGSMITSEDDALVTLQHRTALAWGQFWNLFDEITNGNTPPGVHVDTPLGCCDFGPFCETVPDTQIRERHHGPTCGRETTKARERWHLRTFRGGLARAEAMGFPRAEKMVVAKRWNFAGHVARIRTSNQTLHSFWKCAISPGGGTTEDDGATDNFTDNLEASDAGNITLMVYGSKSGFEWKTVAKDRPRFGASVMEFTKLMRRNHERSRMATMRLGYEISSVCMSNSDMSDVPLSSSHRDDGSESNA